MKLGTKPSRPVLFIVGALAIFSSSADGYGAAGSLVETDYS
jgi:hypothetical protein